MATQPFAFSVHNFISSVGADAGFAAIIGLAVLVLLYFAHARETANLREEAALLIQRLQQAEARVAQLSRVQSGAPQVAPAPEIAPAPAAALAPFAPAGMAAPPLAAATHVIPLPEPDAELAPDGEAEQEPEPALVGVAAPEQAAAAVGAGDVAARVAAPAAVESSPAPVAAMAPAPTAASPSPPASPGPTARAPAPAPATAAGGNGSARRPAGPTPLAGRQLPPLQVSPSRRRPWIGRAIAMAVVALAAVAAAVVLLDVTSLGASKHQPASTTTKSSPATHSPPAGPFTPSSVTVAVLNGTPTNQLAHRVAAKLASGGYRQGTIATAANQTEATTVVAYVAGPRNRTDALHVASALGLRPSVVRAVDQSTLEVACPVPAACKANVVVTVGRDLATS